MKKTILLLTTIVFGLSAMAKTEANEPIEITKAFEEAKKIEKSIKLTSFPARVYNIVDFGAKANTPEEPCHDAINEAILRCNQDGGGTVLIPKCTFYTGPITLKSNVNLFLEEGAVVAAAKTDIKHSYSKQQGEGGNYDEPEINPYVGLQDHGHSYFANSLIYGADLENIMIYGKGLFTGGRFD